MDPRIESLVEQLKDGKIGRYEFQRGLDEALIEVGERAKVSAGDTVEQERIASAAHKARSL